jgi:aldehyde dehydrogenase (NAD+)
MEWLMDARYPPYSVEKLKKLVPAVKPPFDRDGRDVSRGLAKWVFGLGALVLSVAVVMPRQQVQTFVARFVNRG